MIKNIYGSLYHYLTEKQGESLDSSHPPSEKTPLLPEFAAKTPNPQLNNSSFNPPLLKPIPIRPHLNPRIINELLLGGEDSLEFSYSSDSPSILSQSVMGPSEPIKDVGQNPSRTITPRSVSSVKVSETKNITDESIIKLRLLEQKIFSKLAHPVEESNFVFQGKYSEKVFHIFSCESDLSDWEAEFPKLVETSRHLRIKKLLLELDKADFIK